MPIRRSLAALALVLVLAAPAAALPGDLVAPPAGQPVTTDLFKGHPVGMVKGAKRVYTMTMATMGKTMVRELTVDVLEVKGGKVTMRSSGMGQSVTTTVPLAQGALGNEADRAGAKMVSGGNEDVTVPAGTFRRAVKVVTTTKEGAKVTTWIDRRVGVVKSYSEVKMGGVTSSSTMALKSYAP